MWINGTSWGFYGLPTEIRCGDVIWSKNILDPWKWVWLMTSQWNSQKVPKGSQVPNSLRHDACGEAIVKVQLPKSDLNGGCVFPMFFHQPHLEEWSQLTMCKFLWEWSHQQEYVYPVLCLPCSLFTFPLCPYIMAGSPNKALPARLLLKYVLELGSSWLMIFC